MPVRAPLPCRYHGCPRTVPGGGYCQQHRREEYQRQDRNRGTAAQRGYDSAWQRASRRHLRHHPLCVECRDRGVVRAATVVDHVKPHRGDPVLFWDETNWASSCKPCHDAKTARESAFGRGPQWSRREVHE